MKYILCSLLILMSLSMYADKKKSKSKTSPKSTTSVVTNSDGSVSTITADGKATAFVSKLVAMQPDANLFNFDLQDVNGNPVTNETMGDGNVVVVLYNPDCGHCKDLGKEMYAQLDQMKDTKFLFLTGTNMKDFIPQYVLAAEIDAANPAYIFATIEKELTEAIFDYNGIPQVMVYSKEKKLRRVYYQTVDWQDMKSVLGK